MRRILSTLMALTAAGFLSSAASASAAVSLHSPSGTQRFGIRLYDVPLAEAHNPRALRYIIDFLHPGMVIRRRILIVNQEKHRMRFTVYPDAARIAHGMFVGDAGQTRSELTRWIMVQHPVLLLGPHQSTLDLVTIRVPRVATRGEHYGVIWVQQTARVRDGHGTVIKEVARVGIRIYLAVGRGGVPPTKFVITSLTGQRSRLGQPILLARVANTGERAVDLSGQARLSDGPGGIAAGPFLERQVITLAPRQSGSLTFMPSRQLPPGSWRAKVTLVSGLTTSADQSTIQIPGARSGSRISLPALLWAIGIAAGLLVLALIRRAASAGRLAARHGTGAGRRAVGVARGDHGAGG
jgi:hypothetical protein